MVPKLVARATVVAWATVFLWITMLFSTGFGHVPATPALGLCGCFSVRFMTINDMLRDAGTSAMTLLAESVSSCLCVGRDY
ncbi:Uncharacterised protein [Corynebacterium pilosum]|uniref:Uncharacterized protein n=1 Tax=Corynebacterium pilosum TaxID=35756 RepID=A0A376CJC2_9CORY|nr:Uncharacterised protein [Corynebacterium pilosum]